jgi:hypothetical protein
VPAFYIVLQEKIPGVDAVGLEGRALSKHNAKMETLAKTAGVTPLINFFSASETELVALFEDHLIPEYAVSRAKEKWFPAEEGLRTIETLLEGLAWQSAPENPALIRELTEFQRVLQSAHAKTVRWHLGIDY